MRSSDKKSSRCLFACVFLLYAMVAYGEEKNVNEVSERALLSTVHSQQLKKIMRRLDLLAYENEYTALEVESMRVSQINRLVEFAEKLAQTADTLPQLTDQSLSGEDKITFRAMAKQLHADTVQLKNDAAENNYPNMSASYRKLRQTCNSCHRLFRGSRTEQE